MAFKKCGVLLFSSPRNEHGMSSKSINSQGGGYPPAATKSNKPEPNKKSPKPEALPTKKRILPNNKSYKQGQKTNGGNATQSSKVYRKEEIFKHTARIFEWPLLIHREKSLITYLVSPPDRKKHARKMP